MYRMPEFTADISLIAPTSYCRAATRLPNSATDTNVIILALAPPTATAGGPCHASSPDDTMYGGTYYEANGGYKCCVGAPGTTPSTCIYCDGLNNSCGDGQTSPSNPNPQPNPSGSWTDVFPLTPPGDTSWPGLNLVGWFSGGTARVVG
jgi:hypothetical protein